jgi:hypothetical protein
LLGILAVGAAFVLPALLVATAGVVSLGVAGSSPTALVLAFFLALAATARVLASFSVFLAVYFSRVVPAIAAAAVLSAVSVFGPRPILVALPRSLSFAGVISVVLRIARRLVRLRIRCRIIAGPLLV